MRLLIIRAHMMKAIQSKIKEPETAPLVAK